MEKHIMINRPCPCGSQQTYLMCCGPYIQHGAEACTPEALMRSRYTAYHDVNLDYIVRSMKPPASLDFEPEESIAWAKHNKWVKLTVLNSHEADNTGTVEFIAYYQHKNKMKHIHEISEFVRIDGQWFYTKGDHQQSR